MINVVRSDVSSTRPSLVQARQISVTLGSSIVLRQLDLQLAAGELLAVRGRSGSGKSTLLHVLASLIKPETGQVVACGQRMDTLSDRPLLTSLRNTELRTEN